MKDAAKADRNLVSCALLAPDPVRSHDHASIANWLFTPTTSDPSGLFLVFEAVEQPFFTSVYRLCSGNELATATCTELVVWVVDGTARVASGFH
jgi:hypothetical protein